MTGFPSIRPIKPDEVPALVEAAKADNHRPVFPTHIFRKDGEIVGYASLHPNAVHLWFHTQKLKSREVFGLMNALENICFHCGIRSAVIPCNPGSPFLTLMEGMGYTRLEETVLYAKTLT